MNHWLNSKWVNSWRLFWLVSIVTSACVILEMIQTDLTSGEGLSHMIGFSVRLAVPFIYLAMAASSVAKLFPGAISQWWLRNRKYLGICFAVAMAWQGLFIFIISTIMRGYYYSEIYYFRDELEGTVGYVLLAAMVGTTFHFGRSRVSPDQWKLIHKTGIYFLWAYAFSVYWWNLFYYPYTDPVSVPRPIDYAYYTAGFAAFSLRIAAWGVQRQRTAGSRAPLALRVLGLVLIGCGLAAAVTGARWQGAVTGILTYPPPSAEMELWLPFWPLEPFLPLFVIGIGTWVLTSARMSADDKDAAVDAAGN